MRQETNHREVFAKPESLGDDFALIFDAFVDAFRVTASASVFECRCAKIHYAGWR